MNVRASLRLASVILFLCAAGCTPTPRRELVVYAAASTQDALRALAEPFEREHACELVFNFGSSGDLSRQIVAAPRADVFLSADEREMDRVEAAGLLRPGSRRMLLENRLVVIEPANVPSRLATPFAPAALAGQAIRRLALADTETVPAGRYAKAWLERAGVWESVAGRVLPAVDVRAALSAVETGAADAGIVYQSDLARSTRARLVQRVPREQTPPITYPIALIAGGSGEALGRAFVSHLGTDAARERFAAFGFTAETSAEHADPPDPSAPDTGTLAILRTTLFVALGATLVCAPLGIALGYLLARRAFAGKTVVETLVALPLILPPTAIGYLLLVLFARDGWLGEGTLGFDPGVLFTARAAILASALVALPLVARTARAVFEAVDPRLERMARSLGHSRASAFLRVTLPLARRGLLAAALLGFGRALGEFGATVIVAGNIPGRTQTLALAIFSGIQVGDTRAALRFVAIAVALAFATIWCVERVMRGKEAAPR